MLPRSEVGGQAESIGKERRYRNAECRSGALDEAAAITSDTCPWPCGRRQAAHIPCRMWQEKEEARAEREREKPALRAARENEKHRGATAAKASLHPPRRLPIPRSLPWQSFQATLGVRVESDKSAATIWWAPPQDFLPRRGSPELVWARCLIHLCTCWQQRDSTTRENPWHGPWNARRGWPPAPSRAKVALCPL